MFTTRNWTGSRVRTRQTLHMSAITIVMVVTKYYIAALYAPGTKSSRCHISGGAYCSLAIPIVTFTIYIQRSLKLTEAPRVALFEPAAQRRSEHRARRRTLLE
jgi:hypothetical protein